MAESHEDPSIMDAIDQCSYKYCIDSGSYELFQPCANGKYCQRKKGGEGDAPPVAEDPETSCRVFPFKDGHRLILLSRIGEIEAPGLLIYSLGAHVKLCLNLDAYYWAAPDDQSVQHFGPGGSLGNQPPNGSYWQFTLQRGKDLSERPPACSPFIIVSGVCV